MAALTAPTELKSISDPKECVQYALSSVRGMVSDAAVKAIDLNPYIQKYLVRDCDDEIKAGRLLLIWNWSGKEQIDGYRIYRVDGGKHSLVATQKVFTMLGLTQAPDGFNRKCYAVAAYAGSQETELSNAVCVRGGSVVQTMTLQPQQLRSSRKSHSGNTGALTGNDKSGADNFTQLKVGYYYETNKAPAGDFFANEVNRGGLYFDLNSLNGRKIYSARLRLRVDTTYVGSGFDYSDGAPGDNTISCAAKIGIGRNYWWNYTDWIDGSVVLSPGRHVGPDVAMDVTSIVRNWVELSYPNFGFVLFGEDENLNAFTEKACETTYTGWISLEVQYY
ncbi:MAG TPA: hypothetical protein VKE24_05150 [Candidatus Acidoferrales bacterium]|nr:hypothetical protein [Candidatus Acidoferrales bacterium]